MSTGKCGVRGDCGADASKGVWRLVSANGNVVRNEDQRAVVEHYTVSQEHFGKLGDGLLKTIVLSLQFSPAHPKVNDTAAATARETVPIIAIGIHAEGIDVVIVERA
jgi:hypothetical protein